MYVFQGFGDVCVPRVRRFMCSKGSEMYVFQGFGDVCVAVAVMRHHTIKGHRCEVKKALSKEDLQQQGQGGGRGGNYHPWLLESGARISGLDRDHHYVSPQQVTHLPPVWDLLLPLA